MVRMEYSILCRLGRFQVAPFGCEEERKNGFTFSRIYAARAFPAHGAFGDEASRANTAVLHVIIARPALRAIGRRAMPARQGSARVRELSRRG
jgi:hypothetical protein